MGGGRRARWGRAVTEGSQGQENLRHLNTPHVPTQPWIGGGSYCTHFTEEKLRPQKVDLLAKATQPARNRAKGLSGPRREAGVLECEAGSPVPATESL